MNPDLLRGNLDLILLSLLEQRPLYGFAIIQEAREKTGGYFDFKEGSLYPALHRLERAGFLLAGSVTPARGGPPAKTYALTEAGRAELTRRRARYQAFDQALRSLW